MARLRWGAAAPPDSEAARERLIDAAGECFLRYGVMKTTIEDVATVANVSRATVYRYFGGREELIMGVLLREGKRFLGGLGRRLEASRTVQDAIVDGVVLTLAAIRHDDNLALLFAPEAAGVTTSAAGASDALFDLTAQFLHPHLERGLADGTLRPGLDFDEAAEWTLRTILTLVTVKGPRTRTDAQLRSFLHTYLAPALITMSP
ncbi:MAG: TetR/AcrR family transcriptional regulator [Acidimicrobiales bacterium]|nr:TetR/AcrR family transcriptional regulator [Acidimicrobiales bacterium]